MGKRQDPCTESATAKTNCLQKHSNAPDADHIDGTAFIAMCSECEQIVKDFKENCNQSESEVDHLLDVCSEIADGNSPNADGNSPNADRNSTNADGNSGATPVSDSAISIATAILFAVALL